MDYLLLICGLFYLIASVISASKLIAPSKPINNYLIPIIALTLIIHGYWLYQHIMTLHGQNLPILIVLSLVTFIVSLLTTFSGKLFNTGMLQPVVYICAMINLIAVAYLPSQFITHVEAHPVLGLHILLALLAYSILTIGSLFALQLAYLDYRLKNRKLPLTKIDMPPMMSLEKSLFQIVFIGFILLTFTLFTAFFFLEDMFTAERINQAILSIIAWIIYALLLWGHDKHGWRGRITIYCTLSGSSFLTLAYFGSRFVIEVLLN